MGAEPQHAVIARAQAMPKQGASSGFKYGRATGAIEAVIACCENPLTIIEPTAWKEFHQLRGAKGSKSSACADVVSGCTCLACTQEGSRSWVKRH
jgi:hypothetical protein